MGVRPSGTIYAAGRDASANPLILRTDADGRPEAVVQSMAAGADPHASSGWSEAGAAADNAQATATHAAEAGKSHYVTGVSAAFSAAVVGALLEVKEDPGGGSEAVLYRTYVHDQRDLEFPKALKATEGLAVGAELGASGGAGTTGVVSLSGYTI